MSFIASFSITPTASPSTFILEDTSAGSDAGLTGRTIYLYTVSGSLLVAAIPWAIGNSTITLDVLQQDIALNIRVDWASSAPLSPPSTYTYSQIFAFVKYAQDFVNELTQDQASDLSLTQDTDWYNNKLKVICLILSAQFAIDYAENLGNAQMCISLYQPYINNKNYYF